jgi:hypothetical protein
MKANSHGALSDQGNTLGVRERSHHQRLAALERDAALARTSRVRRWAIAGTAALTAGFAALVSVVAPGKSLGAKRTAASAAQAKAPAPAPAPSAKAMPPLASPSQLGLGGPNQAPQSDPSQSSPPPAQSSPAPEPSAPAQSSPAPAQSAPTPEQSAPAPAPSDPSAGSGPVVSGGS